MEALFRTDTLSGSATDYPPTLFSVDAAEFNKRWEEVWDLDFTLAEAKAEAKTGIPRSRCEAQLRRSSNSS